MGAGPRDHVHKRLESDRERVFADGYDRVVVRAHFEDDAPNALRQRQRWTRGRKYGGLYEDARIHRRAATVQTAPGLKAATTLSPGRLLLCCAVLATLGSECRSSPPGQHCRMRSEEMSQVGSLALVLGQGAIVGLLACQSWL